MITHGRFQVVGSFRFRGHDIGEEFEAKVTPQIERAVARRNIVCLELIVPRVPDGFRLPRGWLPE